MGDIYENHVEEEQFENHFFFLFGGGKLGKPKGYKAERNSYRVRSNNFTLIHDMRVRSKPLAHVILNY